MPVGIKGLTDLRAALRSAGDTAGRKTLRDVNFEVGKLILAEARPSIASESSTVAASGTAVRSELGARLRYTDVKAGGYLYGANHDRQRRGPSGRRYRGYNQFPRHKAEGRHVEPVVDEQMEAIAEKYRTGLVGHFRRAGVPAS